jgi:NIMA-interacting peptidyl-prolyl cis-trans isomerase 1
VRYSNTRQRPYFFNEAQSLSIWEAPTGLSEDDIVNLPGASENLHKKAEDTVQASHLLIKHAGSRRPSSWKEVCSQHRDQIVTGFADA